MKLVATSVMRELDRRAIEEGGIKGEDLMQRAGEGVASVVRRIADAAGYDAPMIHLVAGRGNNGGDAFAAARSLKQMGYGVEVWLAGSDNQVRGDALIHLSRMKADGIALQELPTLEDWQDAIRNPFVAEIIVDGILGTGAAGPARGPAAGAIQYINSQTADCFCVSIDVPSGLNADTGEAEGDAVLADLTATLGLPKKGLVAPSAIEFVGAMDVLDIGIPPGYVAEASAEEDIELIHALDLRACFPRRKRAAHKGQFGHVLLMGGSRGMTGSIALAARAALRSGAGLVSVLTPDSIAASVATIVPEAMVHPGPENKEGGLSAALGEAWRKRMDGFSAVLVGPGMGRTADTLNIVRALVRECEAPLIMDADALAVLEGQADLLNKARRPVVLTPHPGEMGRLIHRDTEDVQADRWGVARRAAVTTRGVVVLKGAGTVVAQEGRPLGINLSGNPGMATAGCGDVLAGLITGFVGQGLSGFDAARAGVHVHGRAGDLAAWRKCQASLTAGDVLDELPFALRDLTLR